MKNEIDTTINLQEIQLMGVLKIPPKAKGIIIFAHGSGSSRHSPRNKFVAQELNKIGFATLLMDLLTDDEESDRGNVFDIDLLARRLIQTKHWLSEKSDTQDLPIGYFGASTGAGAALVATALEPRNIFAVVSRGGRPDLAEDKLKQIITPTLFIVGGLDTLVLDLNRDSYNLLHCEKKLEIVPGATHLFEEPGTLEQVSRYANHWFASHINFIKTKNQRKDYHSKDIAGGSASPAR